MKVKDIKYFSIFSILFIFFTCQPIYKNSCTTKFKINIPFKKQYIKAKLFKKSNNNKIKIYSAIYPLKDFIKDSTKYLINVNNNASYTESVFCPYDFVDFSLAKDDEVKIVFYTSIGDSILLFKKFLSAGKYSFSFKDSILNFGIYFIKIENSEIEKIFNRIYGIPN